MKDQFGNEILEQHKAPLKRGAPVRRDETEEKPNTIRCTVCNSAIDIKSGSISFTMSLEGKSSRKDFHLTCWLEAENNDAFKDNLYGALYFEVNKNVNDGDNTFVYKRSASMQPDRTTDREED